MRPSAVAKFKAAQERSVALREQVRDTFSRVLHRHPEVRTSILGESFGVFCGALHIHLRGNDYILQVTSFKKLEVTVYKTDMDSLASQPITGFADTRFFSYDCSAGKLGKLRKTALILLKKMDNREVHEVMDA